MEAGATTAIKADLVMQFSKLLIVTFILSLAQASEHPFGKDGKRRVLTPVDDGLVAGPAPVQAPPMRPALMDIADLPIADMGKVTPQVAKLIRAIEFGDEEAVSGFLQGIEDVNLSVPVLELSNSLTLLQLAVYHHRPSVVRRLLDAGANADFLSAHGKNVLFMAVQEPHFAAELSQILLEHGANPFIVDANGNSLLHAAAGALGHSSAIQVLYDLVPELISLANAEGKSPMAIACEADNLANVLELISCGASIEPFQGRQKLLVDLVRGLFSGDIQMPIEMAAEIIRSLIHCNRHLLKVVDDKGFTALHYAARSNFFELVQVLMGEGASGSVNQVGHQIGMKWAPVGQAFLLEPVYGQVPEYAMSPFRLLTRNHAAWVGKAIPLFRLAFKEEIMTLITAAHFCDSDSAFGSLIRDIMPNIIGLIEALPESEGVIMHEGGRYPHGEWTDLTPLNGEVVSYMLDRQFRHQVDLPKEMIEEILKYFNL